MDKEISSFTSNKSWSVVLPMALCLLFIQGCAQYQLDMKDSDPVTNVYEENMIHALGWGLLYSPMQITTVCNTETGINDVVVKNNYLYSLASVLTFGLWMPIEIEHRCQAGTAKRIDFNDKK